MKAVWPIAATQNQISPDRRNNPASGRAPINGLAIFDVVTSNSPLVRLR